MASESVRDRLPATTVGVMILLDQSQARVEGLEKELAKIGCTCTVKQRSTQIEDHEAFCRFRASMENLL